MTANTQSAPAWSADILAELVEQLTYKPGWTFTLKHLDRGQGCSGLTLVIENGDVPDSWDPEKRTNFCHLMPVLPAAYDREAWTGWLLEQIRLVELHECLEFFQIAGEKVRFPYHRPGGNPYEVHRVVTADDALAPPVPWSGGATA